MLQAMFSGISAIQAHQERMDVIGNNIANVNTTGYKAGRVTFQDQFSETLQGASKGAGKTSGGTNPQQIGLGVRVGSIDSIMAQGGMQSTSRPTDMAIEGNGYFMLGDGTGMHYTRDGSFSVDNNGSLVNATNGAYVLGWSADATGKIDAGKEIGPASHLSIPVGGLTVTSPTTAATFTGNLNAGATAAAPAYVRSIKTYDSLGNPQNVTLSFTRQANGNAWNWTASGDAGAAGTGTINFDASGNTSGATGTISLTPGNGAAPQTITPDFSRLTQVAGDSNAAPSDQNGYPPGTLQSFGINQTGLITGIFSNGMTRSLGQVAVTGFANPEGLSRSGGNEFQATINSGLPQVGTATQGGLGKISTGYLEQSNVDLSNEFTNMIVTQRGFQANTKIVTTVDEMLNDVIHLKQ